MAQHYNGISANYTIKPKEAFPQESINNNNSLFSDKLNIEKIETISIPKI